VFFLHFFIVVSFRESSDLYYKGQGFLEEKLNNQSYEEYLSTFHLTSENVKDRVDEVRGAVNQWLIENGYDKFIDALSKLNTTGMTPIP
jgi:hypothetical protein